VLKNVIFICHLYSISYHLGPVAPSWVTNYRLMQWIGKLVI